MVHIMLKHLLSFMLLVIGFIGFFALAGAAGDAQQDQAAKLMVKHDRQVRAQARAELTAELARAAAQKTH